VIGKKQQNNRTKDFIVDTEKRGREGPLFFVVCGPPGGLWKYWDCLKILIVVKRTKGLGKLPEVFAERWWIRKAKTKNGTFSISRRRS
jgi:hypothetical protein